MIVCFKEKYGDRFIEGENLQAILAHVLKERIEDTYGAMFGKGTENSDMSIWYEEDTEKAKKLLDEGKAVAYMSSRRGHEYEDWFEVRVETIGGNE